MTPFVRVSRGGARLLRRLGEQEDQILAVGDRNFSTHGRLAYGSSRPPVTPSTSPVM